MTIFLQIQEINLNNPTVTSSTTTARCSPPIQDFTTTLNISLTSDHHLKQIRIFPLSPNSRRPHVRVCLGGEVYLWGKTHTTHTMNIESWYTWNTTIFTPGRHLLKRYKKRYRVTTPVNNPLFPLNCTRRVSILVLGPISSKWNKNWNKFECRLDNFTPVFIPTGKRSKMIKNKQLDWNFLFFFKNLNVWV